MGFSVFLNYVFNEREFNEFIFKLSFYPYELCDQNIPDKDLPESLDVKYLANYLKMLKHVEWMIRTIPDVYLKFNTTSNDIETLHKCVLDDMHNISNAIDRANAAKTLGCNTWLSVG